MVRQDYVVRKFGGNSYITLFFLSLQRQKKKKKKKVRIQTMLGDIVVRLYDETPLHRNNFLKLVKGGIMMARYSTSIVWSLLLD